MKHNSAFTVIEGVVLAAIVAILLSLVLIVRHRENVTMPAAYRAWVKQTGNAKGITYEEWRVLLRASESSGYAPVILIPH